MNVFLKGMRNDRFLFRFFKDLFRTEIIFNKNTVYWVFLYKNEKKT